MLPQPYEQTIELFVSQGWLVKTADVYQTTPVALPFVDAYQQRLERARLRTMAEVRQAIEERDTGEALEIRRKYESSHPLGSADWSGPQPQLSRSSLTRRILYLQHWLLDGLSPETAEWLKLYAAEQHLWETDWRLREEDIPAAVANELATSEMDAVEAAYWRAYGMALLVDNQETWQRCKGGDHVRRIEIAGPDDEFTCEHCREIIGQRVSRRTRAGVAAPRLHILPRLSMSLRTRARLVRRGVATHNFASLSAHLDLIRSAASCGFDARQSGRRYSRSVLRSRQNGSR